MNQTIIIAGRTGFVDDHQASIIRAIVWKAWYNHNELLLPDLHGTPAIALEHAARLGVNYRVVGWKPQSNLNNVSSMRYVNIARKVRYTPNKTVRYAQMASWMIEQAHAVVIVGSMTNTITKSIFQAAADCIPVQIVGETDYETA